MPLPTIRITPNNALADRRVDISLDGFEPGQRVTVRAHMRDDLNRLWLSQAGFVTGPSGEAHLATQAPILGSYAGADPMGLIWSMTLDPGEGEASRFMKQALTPIVITFTAEVDWEPVATAALERVHIAPGVERVPVRDDHLIATFFYPLDGRPRPGIVVLGGADGGMYEGVAARLASHGFAALSLAYFGADHLSPTLANIPLEYFKAALAWMVAQPQVAPGGVSLAGWSRGGEAALLIGATYQQLVHAVVAYVPSGLMTVSAARGVPDLADAQSSWSYGGRPLPFLPWADDGSAVRLSEQVQAGRTISLRPLYEAALTNHDAIERTAIPVERISGPVLLISGESDAMWPSSLFCEMVMQRLNRHNHPHPYKHLRYPNAGHTIGVPYRPTTVTEHRTPGGALLQFGGTAPGNAHAESDSWRQVLDFLK